MKYFASTFALALTAAIALPTPAISQSVPPNLNGCIEEGCWFHPTTAHEALVVLRDSVHKRNRETVDFVYLLLPHGVINPNQGRRTIARVNCSYPDHWHVRRFGFYSKEIPAESPAAQRMLNFVCHQAGIDP